MMIILHTPRFFQTSSEELMKEHINKKGNLLFSEPEQYTKLLELSTKLKKSALALHELQGIFDYERISEFQDKIDGVIKSLMSGGKLTHADHLFLQNYYSNLKYKIDNSGFFITLFSVCNLFVNTVICGAILLTVVIMAQLIVTTSSIVLPLAFMVTGLIIAAWTFYSAAVELRFLRNSQIKEVESLVNVLIDQNTKVFLPESGSKGKPTDNQPTDVTPGEGYPASTPASTSGATASLTSF